MKARIRPRIRPRVLNRRTLQPADAAHSIYVGRPSRWGNPWIPGRNAADRLDAIARYRAWADTPAMRDRIRRDLRGWHLVCWCAPKPCHADVLLEIANADEV
jgi:hypothetical protein